MANTTYANASMTASAVAGAAKWAYQCLAALATPVRDSALFATRSLRQDPAAELMALAASYEERQPSYAADLRAAAMACDGTPATNLGKAA